MPIGHLYVFFGQMSVWVCPFFDWVVGFFVIELCELFVYFANKALVKCVICKYFLLFCRLSFHFVCGFLHYIVE